MRGDDFTKIVLLGFAMFVVLVGYAMYREDHDTVRLVLLRDNHTEIEFCDEFDHCIIVPREGLVFRPRLAESDPLLGQLSFKVINVDYLLKTGG